MSEISGELLEVRVRQRRTGVIVGMPNGQSIAFEWDEPDDEGTGR